MKPTEQQRLAIRERPHDRRPVMKQAWRNLAFLHWEIDPDVIQQTLPPGLFVDTFDGQAFIGIVPFYMRRVRPVYLPSVPGISFFLEVNVRTYVYDENGTPGVWFYSLDANQWLAVKIARSLYKLPYFHATMAANRYSATPSGDTLDVRYSVQRKGSESASQFVYRGQGALRTAEPGTLAFFLVERYVLFAYSAETNTLFSGQVHHPPYTFQDAESDRMGQPTAHARWL